MEGSLVVSRKPSSHALSSGRSVSGDQLGMELVHGTRYSTTKPTSNGEKTTDESSSSSSEPIFYDFLATLENDHQVHQVGEAEGLDETDASLELKLYLDPWAIKKTIQKSDIGHLSRLLLAKKEVEKHILPLWDAGRIESIHNGVRVGVGVWDFDTQSEHQLIFKQRPSNRSYALIGKWTNEFVMRRSLKEGDEIGLYWDQSNSRFNFTILKGAAVGTLLLEKKLKELECLLTYSRKKVEEPEAFGPKPKPIHVDGESNCPGACGGISLGTSMHAPLAPALTITSTPTS